MQQDKNVENVNKIKIVEKSTVPCMKKESENQSYTDVVKGDNLWLLSTYCTDEKSNHKVAYTVIWLVR